MLEILTVIWMMIAAVVVAFVTQQVQAGIGLTWHTAYLIAINIVAFLIYVYDKLIAGIRGALHLDFLPLRVPTPVMTWGLAFFGGIIGALFGIAVSGHKTSGGEGGFREELYIAGFFGILGAVLLYEASRSWGLISLEQVDTFIAGASSALIELAQTLVQFARGFLG